jgi:hypothetical protein
MQLTKSFSGIAVSQKGRTYTDEQCRRISETMTGRTYSPDSMP